MKVETSQRYNKVYKARVTKKIRGVFVCSDLEENDIVEIALIEKRDNEQWNYCIIVKTDSKYRKINSISREEHDPKDFLTCIESTNKAPQDLYDQWVKIWDDKVF